MVKIDVITTVKVDDADHIVLTSTYEAEVQYTFKKELKARSNCEIWVRAGTEEKLQLLTIKAYNGEGESMQPAYIENDSDKCPELFFKALHRKPDGEEVTTERIELDSDRFFDPKTRDKLFPEDLTELEAIVLTNNSDNDIGCVEVFVARDG